MTVKRKTTRKKRATGKKKTSPHQKRLPTYLAVVLAGFLILTVLFGYGLYRSLRSRPSRRIPIFETDFSGGAEAKVKQIDRCIYDALLDLHVPAGEVEFKSVETKKDKEGLWTFSEMQIRLPRTISQRIIKSAFYKRFSGIVPTASLRFASGPSNEISISISANGRQTHRLVFLTVSKDKPVIPPPHRLPMVAIIIDDLGYDRKIASKFLELDAPLSFSVLPNSPFKQSIAAAIHRRGREVILHLPMEPLEYPNVDSGGGTLLCSMDPDELLEQLRKNLDAVPFVVGVNNHMGSSLTQDSAKMRQIFTVLKRHNLFFVDSLTNPGSRCAQAAKLLQIRFARRNVFLDHAQDPHAIRFQIKRLLSLAKTKGRAIGIGHPYPVTLEVLKEDLPSIEQQADLVRISQLVE